LTPRGRLLEYCVDSRHLAAHRLLPVRAPHLNSGYIWVPPHTNIKYRDIESTLFSIVKQPANKSLNQIHYLPFMKLFLWRCDTFNWIQRSRESTVKYLDRFAILRIIYGAYLVCQISRLLRDRTAPVLQRVPNKTLTNTLTP